MIARVLAIGAVLGSVDHRRITNRLGIGSRREIDAGHVRLDDRRIAARNGAARRGIRRIVMDAATETMTVNVREVHPASRSPQPRINLLTMELFQSFNQN